MGLRERRESRLHAKAGGETRHVVLGQPFAMVSKRRVTVRDTSGIRAEPVLVLPAVTAD